MSDDDELVEPASSGLPIVTGTDGQPYIPVLAAVHLLRAIDIEADAIEVRAIAATTGAAA